MASSALYVVNGMEAAFAGASAWFSSLIVGHSYGGMLALAASMGGLAFVRKLAAIRHSQEPSEMIPKALQDGFVTSLLILVLAWPVTVQIAWYPGINGGKAIPVDFRTMLSKSEAGRGLLQIAGQPASGPTLNQPPPTIGQAMVKQMVAPLVNNQGLVVPALIYTTYNMATWATFTIFNKVGWTSFFTTDFLPPLLARSQYQAQDVGRVLDELIKEDAPKASALGLKLDRALAASADASLANIIGEAFQQEPAWNTTVEDRVKARMDAFITYKGRPIPFDAFVQCKTARTAMWNGCLGLSIYAHSRGITHIKLSPASLPWAPLTSSPLAVASFTPISNQQIIAELRDQEGDPKAIKVLHPGMGPGNALARIVGWVRNEAVAYRQRFHKDVGGDPSQLNPDDVTSLTGKMVMDLAFAGMTLARIAHELDPNYVPRSRTIDMKYPAPFKKVLLTRSTGVGRLNLEPTGMTIGKMIKAMLGEGHDAVGVFADKAGNIAQFGKKLVETSNKLYAVSKTASDQVNNVRGTTTNGWMTGAAGLIASVMSFAVNPMAGVYAIVASALNFIAYLALLAVYIAIVGMIAKELAGLPFHVVQCGLESGYAPMLHSTIRVLTAKLAMFGFLAASLISYIVAGLIAAGSVVHAGSVVQSLLALFTQITLTSLFAWMFKGLLRYVPTSPYGPSGGGGGGGGDMEGRKAARDAALTAAGGVAAASAGAKAGKVAGGAVHGGAAAGMQLLAQGGEAASALASGGGGGNRRKEGAGRRGGGGAGGGGDDYGGMLGGIGGGGGGGGPLGGGASASGGSSSGASATGAGGRAQREIPDFTGGKQGMSAILHGAAMGAKNPHMVSNAFAARMANAADNVLGVSPGGRNANNKAALAMSSIVSGLLETNALLGNVGLEMLANKGNAGAAFSSAMGGWNAPAGQSMNIASQ